MGTLNWSLSPPGFARFVWDLQDACLCYNKEWRAAMRGEGKWRSVQLTHPSNGTQWAVLAEAKRADLVEEVSDTHGQRVTGELILTSYPGGVEIARLPLPELYAAWEKDGHKALDRILKVTYNIAKAGGKVAKPGDNDTNVYATGWTDPRSIFGSPGS